MSPDAASLPEDKESQVDLAQFTWVEGVIRDLYEVLRRLERLERLVKQRYCQDDGGALGA